MQTIDQDVFEAKRNSIRDVTVINTLPPEDFENTKIPGTLNISADQKDFVERVEAAVMKNHKAEIVVYCASQACDSSTKAAARLEQAGFEKVFDYEGGYEDWKSQSNSS